MIPFGLILAQVMTLSVADRTEGRYVVGDYTRYEAVTVPTLALSSQWRHLTLNIGGGSSFTVTPLESKSRDLIVLNAGSIAATYKWQRTTLRLSETASYGRVNFIVQALADGQATGLPGAGQPGAGTGAAPPAPPLGIGTLVGVNGVPVTSGGAQAAAQLRASSQIVRYFSSYTGAGLSHASSPSLLLNAELGYLIAGAVDAADEKTYPLTKGPKVLGSARLRIGHQDAVSSTLVVQYVESSGGAQVQPGAGQPSTSAYQLTFNEAWLHALDPDTTTELGVGVSGTRSPLGNDFYQNSIYPTGTASITHKAVSVARGGLNLRASVATAPALDLVTLKVDPRLSIAASIGWARDKFSSSVSGFSALSFSNAQQNGLTSVGGAYVAGYRLGSAVGIDSGVRLAYQTYAATTVIPLTYAIFVGLTFGAATPLR